MIYVMVADLRPERDSISGPVISVICPTCQTVLEFPARLNGSTQSCKKCSAFLDIGNDDETDEWADDEPASK